MYDPEWLRQCYDQLYFKGRSISEEMIIGPVDEACYHISDLLEEQLFESLVDSKINL